MATPQPTLTLLLDVDERLADEELKLEIDRCYTHVATTLLRTHPAGAQVVPQDAGDEPVNVIRFLVKMGACEYLDPAEEGADELWSEVMERWFHNQFYKVGNNLQIFNRRQEEIGREPLDFDWLEVELQNGELSAFFRLDSRPSIDPDSNVFLTALRAHYASGALGSDVARVLMPSPADYGKQRTAGLAAKAEREAAEEEARKAAEEAAAKEAEERAAAAEEAFLEMPETQEDELAAEQARIDAELAAKYDLPDPDFPIDYHLWLVEYADGTSREFDSTAGSFVD